VGALIHLHVLKVLGLDARLGEAASATAPGTWEFLALPLLLPRLAARLGSPHAGLFFASGFEKQVVRHWDAYMEHLVELVPRVVFENLLASLVPRIVEPS
jgi:hypothetical protein